MSDANNKFVIMFVCTGNTCRSPMAEAALRVLLNKEDVDNYEVISSGTGAASGFPATMFAIEAAKIWDADLSKHESQPLTQALIDRSDLILAMTPSHYREVLTQNPEAVTKTFLLEKYPEPGDDGMGIDDPIGQSLDRYNQTFLEIGEHLGRILPDLVEKIKEKRNVD